MGILAGFLAAFLTAQHITPPAGDMFDDADGDGNGTLTFDEIRAILPSISHDVFMAVDTNGDGVIDGNEFDIGVEEGLIPER